MTRRPVAATGNSNSTQFSSDREDRIEFSGLVVEVLPSTTFRVKTQEGHVVICSISGRMRTNKIRIILGDLVTIETTPYDLNRGRITRRL